MSSAKVSSFIRSNVMGIIAIFIALGGTAYAVDGPNPGQNTVGSEDIIGNEVKSDDIGNGRIFNLDIADEIIQGGKIKDGTIASADVADETLTGADVDDGTITGDDVANDTLGEEEIGSILLVGPSGNAASGAYQAEFGENVGLEVSRYFSANTNLFPLLRMSGNLAADQLDFVNGTDLDLNFGFLEMDEATEPSAPAADDARLFLRDNGTGDTQLMVIFGNGDVDQLAISAAP